MLRKDTPHEVATEVSLNTAFGVERVVRYAFERAVARPRKHLTLIHKTNVLTHAGGLWSRTVEEVAAEFPEVTVAYQHVDAASMFFITDPGRYDVIVTDNLFGDIVTDIAAAVTGGIGLAASGNLDASGTNPSMFEPVHGSAPDIAGQGIADPTATVLSVGLLLDHLGRTEQAKKVNAAVAFDLSTRDPAGPGPHRRRRRPAGRPRQRLRRRSRRVRPQQLADRHGQHRLAGELLRARRTPGAPGSSVGETSTRTTGRHSHSGRGASGLQQAPGQRCRQAAPPAPVERGEAPVDEPVPRRRRVPAGPCGAPVSRSGTTCPGAPSGTR